MHVMIATDGSLDPIRTTTTAARLAGEDGQITVVTVVEVSRTMLDGMRTAAADGDPPGRDVEFRSAQATNYPASHWVGDDAVVDRYVGDQVRSRTADLVAALDDAGLDHEVVGIEGENAARSLLERLAVEPVDFLLIGTHGLGRFEGLLGSNSTKLARRAPCSVVLVR
jgi:nucleotide-binding universal stress UspA family protein